jgi:hypothetical protein
MQEGPPSPAPLPSESGGQAATNAVAAGGAVAARPVRAGGVKRAWHAARRFTMMLFGVPTGRWPAPTVTSLLVAAVALVGLVELLPKTVSDVTLSVSARTEVIAIELDPQRKYVWWLPAGTYSLLTAAGTTGCEERKRFDVTCTYEEPTALTIENGAAVRFEVIPGGADGEVRFTAALTPRSRALAGDRALPASAFSLHDASDRQLAATGDLVTFESGLVDVWRIPLILERVQIGESLSESISTADTIGAVRQPIMTEGDVRIFARTIGRSDHRYLIQDERFDPADVVQIPADPETRTGLLYGLLSLDRASDHVFDVTLHTALAEVYVRRLAAEHRIGVSMWSIVSELPTWAALWVVWVSLILVANYHAARLQQLQGEPNEQKQSA